MGYYEDEIERAKQESNYFQLAANHANEIIDGKLVELEARIKSLEDSVFKPCTYEVRSRPVYQNYHSAHGGYTESAVWCQRHGWDCPNGRTQSVS